MDDTINVLMKNLIVSNLTRLLTLLSVYAVLWTVYSDSHFCSDMRFTYFCRTSPQILAFQKVSSVVALNVLTAKRLVLAAIYLILCLHTVFLLGCYCELLIIDLEVFIRVIRLISGHVFWVGSKLGFEFTLIFS